MTLSSSAEALARENLESRLAKMAIRCDGVGQPSFPHDDEARAVGKRELFVTVLKEQPSRLLKSVAVDALPAKPGASVDLLPPAFRSVQAETDSKKRQRLIDHKIGRDQHPTGLQCRIPNLAAALMFRVAGIGTGGPTRGVDKEGIHGLYRTAS